MQFFEVGDTRRSVRAFIATPIERDKLETILATARLAPSAGNLQAYQIVVIDEVNARAALAAAALGQHFVAEAPVVLVFCASPELSERTMENGVSFSIAFRTPRSRPLTRSSQRRRRASPHAGLALSMRRGLQPCYERLGAFARWRSCQSATPPKRRTGPNGERSTSWFIMGSGRQPAARANNRGPIPCALLSVREGFWMTVIPESC